MNKLMHLDPMKVLLSIKDDSNFETISKTSGIGQRYTRIVLNKLRILKAIEIEKRGRENFVRLTEKGIKLKILVKEIRSL